MKKINLSLFLLSSLMFLGCSHSNWRTADRSSVGLAPKPENEKQAVVQIYAARTVGWRGYFAVHSWLAYKEENSDHYMVYHVIGWRLRRGLSPVSIERDVPDKKWFGEAPDLILDLRGPQAAKAIPKIVAAGLSYSYPHSYRPYPGPNSNTFISHIMRNVPEIRIELPPHAMGRDWIDDGDLFGWSESSTGFQFSVYGLLGATVGVAEGVEFNLLGMTFGFDILRPALKLPFVGRIGFSDAPL